jgi:hypothetical protein
VSGVPASLSPRQRGHAVKAQELIEAVGGLEAAALHCRIRKSQLGDCQSRNVAAFLPQDAIADLEAVAGAPIVTRHLAALSGHVLLPLPQAEEDENGLLLSVIEITSELGDLARAIEAALRPASPGGRSVTAAEATGAIEQLGQLDTASARLRRKLQAIADGNRD